MGSASLSAPRDQVCFSKGSSNSPKLCSLCSRSQRVKAGVSPPAKLMPFYISFCHHHLRSPQDKLQRGKLKRTIQGSDQILQGLVKGFRKRQQSEHRIFINFTHFLGYLQAPQQQMNQQHLCLPSLQKPDLAHAPTA